MTNDNANLRRAVQLFEEIDRRLYDRTKRSGLGSWEPLVDQESAQLAREREVALENVVRLGRNRQEMEDMSQEWHQQCYAERKQELRQMSISGATIESSEPEHESCAAKAQLRPPESDTLSEDPKPVRRRKKRKVTKVTRESSLRRLLAKRSFSLRDWASESGVDPHTIIDYVKGKRTPYPTTLRKLAAGLGIEVEKLPK